MWEIEYLQVGDFVDNIHQVIQPVQPVVAQVQTNQLWKQKENVFLITSIEFNNVH